MEFPFKENQIGESTFIREFSQNTNSEELIWHRDKEDRIIESVDKTNWMIQLDNELPKLIEGEIFIPKETFHRLIKGDGDLKIKLLKLKD